MGLPICIQPLEGALLKNTTVKDGCNDKTANCTFKYKQWKILIIKIDQLNGRTEAHPSMLQVTLTLLSSSESTGRAAGPADTRGRLRFSNLGHKLRKYANMAATYCLMKGLDMQYKGEILNS